MGRFNHEAAFEVIDDETGICWEIVANVNYDISGGCAPWKGSKYTCPSDVDWYGDPGDVEIDSIEIVSVTEYDDDGNADDVELDAWEEPAVLAYVEENIDDYDLHEAAGDQDDYDPPEPDYDYDDCPRYYDGTGRY